MRPIHCPGCREHYMHKSDEPRTFRCSACHDTATQETVGNVVESRNVFGKLVDRKQVFTGPQKARPTQEPDLGYTVYSGFGVK